jgi:cytochrome oxidase Cu insertion factor (SCO1/SenC/PrrC family)
MVLLSRSKVTLLILLVGLIAVLVGVQAYLQRQRGSGQARPGIPGLLWPRSKAITPFSLVDQHGQPFNLARLKGRWTFLFFGYSHCPDICPVTLTVMNNVDKLLKDSPGAADDTQFAFVTVDPARDTPEHLAGYVGYFNQDFLGITGEDGELHRLTRQLGILYVRNKPEPDGSYLVDHTASILLVGPDARLIALFGAPHDARVIADRFRQIRRLVEG